MRHNLRRVGIVPQAGGARPWTVYDCSCGAHIPGRSRRQARAWHRNHLSVIREREQP